MVDFNNEATVSTPSTNIVKVLVLQARALLFESLEAYYSQRFSGITPNDSVVRARLLIAFYELQGYLKRTLPAKSKEDNKSFTDLFGLLYKTELTEKDLQDLIEFLNVRLDKLKITQLDTHKSFDRTSWEEDNKAHGY